MTRRGAEAEPRLVVTQGSFGGDAPPSVLLHHFAHQVERLSTRCGTETQATAC